MKKRVWGMLRQQVGGATRGCEEGKGGGRGSKRRRSGRRRTPVTMTAKRTG